MRTLTAPNWAPDFHAYARPGHPEPLVACVQSVTLDGLTPKSATLRDPQGHALILDPSTLTDLGPVPVPDHERYLPTPLEVRVRTRSPARSLIGFLIRVRFEAGHPQEVTILSPTRGQLTFPSASLLDVALTQAHPSPPASQRLRANTLGPDDAP